MEKRTIIILSVVLLFVSLGFYSCKTNDDISSFSEEIEVLKDYLQTNNISVTPTASGLYYIEIKEGSGDFPKTGDTVSVKYVGKFLNGNIFDSGTFSFVLGRGMVIKGWDEGIALMKKGGKAQLIIPSNLAYGSAGSGSIPPYSTLIFDVELLSIQ